MNSPNTPTTNPHVDPIQVIINHPNFGRVVALLRQWGRERLERERAALDDSELAATESEYGGDGGVLDWTPIHDPEPVAVSSEQLR